MLCIMISAEMVIQDPKGYLVNLVVQWEFATWLAQRLLLQIAEIQEPQGVLEV